MHDAQVVGAGAVSLMLVFVSGSTFSALGIVLYTMADELHWSMAGAGASFSVLGIACCLARTLPAPLMRRVERRRAARMPAPAA